ncbi:MAG: ABC transporter substrate-binding protein [Chloroflexota bacterium]
MSKFINIFTQRLVILISLSTLLLGCNALLGNEPTPTPIPTPTLLPPLARAVTILPDAIIVPIPIDPPSFNAYINDTGYEELIGELVFGALAELDPAGQYYPELALDVPTLENGGLSQDGLTVTWQLRPGLVWSDGEPFTTRDVIFTWQSLRDSNIFAPGFDLIDSIDAPDAHTVIIHYREFYPNYRLQFGGEGVGIFPAHHCGDTDRMLLWDCNLNPVSLGPFVLEEWQAGERLVFNANPNFWMPNRPLAQQLIFTIQAEAEIREQQLRRGEAHLDLWSEEPFLTRFEEDEDVFLQETNPARFVLRFVPNLSDFGTADTAQPHPILADKRVRQAIRHAINIPLIIEEVFDNRAYPIHSELTRQGCVVPEYPYNPAKANALLWEAGWVDSDNDDVRECRGCLYAEEGTIFKFESFHYAEFGSTLAQAHRRMELMLFDVGVDIRPKPVEGFDLWGTWADEGVETRGDYHLNLWDDGYFGIDPTDYFYNRYDPRTIPTRNDPLSGFNVMRYLNRDVVDIFDQLQSPLTDEERQAQVCQLAQILANDIPDIPLLALPDYYALHRRLQGVSGHIYDTITWNAGDWHLLPESEE